MTESPSKKRRLSPVTRFVVLFLIFLVIVSVGFSQLFTRYHDQMLWLMDLTAFVTGGTLSLFLDGVTYSGRYVSYEGFPVEIIDECTGLFEMLIYLAAVLSFSTTIKKKLIGAAIGVPAIYVFNIVRIAVLLLIGAESQAAFEFMHLYLWQITLIIMIATVWVGWLYLVVYREKRSDTVSA